MYAYWRCIKRKHTNETKQFSDRGESDEKHNIKEVSTVQSMQRDITVCSYILSKQLEY